MATTTYSYRGSGGNPPSLAAMWGSQSGNNGGLGNFGGKDTNMGLLFTGTQIDMYLQDSAAPGDTNMGFTLDGTYHAIDPPSNATQWLTLISGLADTQHRLMVWSFTGGLSFGYDTLFRVTGANPSVATPTTTLLSGSNGLTAPSPSINYIVFDGDSRTYGLAATGQLGNTTTGGSYPALMIASLGGNYNGHNQSQSGDSLQGLADVAPYDVDTQYSSVYKTNTVIMGGGYNDIGGGRTVAQLQADAIRFVQGRQAAGFKVLGCTCYHQQVYGGLDQYNAWLKAGGSGCEWVSDLASVPNLPYASDGIHLTDYSLIASQVQTDYLALLSGASLLTQPLSLPNLNQGLLSVSNTMKGQENEIF